MIRRILILVALAAILGAAVGAGPVLAAKGGKGKGNGGGNGTTAMLWVEPDTQPFPPYGYGFTVQGSGFNANSIVHVSFTNDNCCLTFNAESNSSGEISFPWRTGNTGTYTFSAYQDRKGHKWSIYARVDVIVSNR